MNRIDRRAFLLGVINLSLTGYLSRRRGSHSSGSRDSAIGLAIGNYGMKTLTAQDALRACATIGYDGVELSLLPGWPTEPRLLSRQDRRDLRAMLVDLRLATPSLLESLKLTADAGGDQPALDRLKIAAELARDLAPQAPPIIETTLGGKPGDWERTKGRMAEGLGRWAELGGSMRQVICVKAHVAQAVNTPERLLWLLNQVNSPWIGAIYDYSHFHLAGLELTETLEQLMRFTRLIHVKDSRGDSERYEFLLPGEGKVNYVEYLKTVKRLGYNGFIVAEVSAQVQGQPGYEPISAARKCYGALTSAFAKAQVRRPHRQR